VLPNASDPDICGSGDCSGCQYNRQARNCSFRQEEEEAPEPSKPKKSTLAKATVNLKNLKHFWSTKDLNKTAKKQKLSCEVKAAAMPGFDWRLRYPHPLGR
jgi:hypothetical protein